MISIFLMKLATNNSVQLLHVPGHTGLKEMRMPISSQELNLDIH
jgi:hypothetical protein